MTDLFMEKPVLQFEKVAYVDVDEDPNKWPRQILTELYRVVPEVSNYTPRVAMMKTDTERGYGYGTVIIENTTNSALATTNLTGTPKQALIPVVIKNYQLCPLDLLMTAKGKMVPLNEHRLREALFRPETFEMITDDWGDTSLYQLFYPPGRSDNDINSGEAQSFGSGSPVSYMYGSGMKLGQLDDFALLKAVRNTLYASDLDGLAKAASAFAPELSNGSVPFLHGLAFLAEASDSAVKSASPIVDAALDVAGFDVLQLKYHDDLNAYSMKVANRKLYRDTGIRMFDRGDFLKFAGENLTNKIDTEGAVTIAASTQGDTEDENWVTVETPGVYKVKTIHGKELSGWVLPNLIDLDGTISPMAIFTNGSSACVQSQIAGKQISALSDLPSVSPKGTGCFYAGDQSGVLVTVPLLVEGEELGMDGSNSWLCKSFTGEEATVRIVPGIKKMLALEGELLIPESAKFLPMNDEDAIVLAQDPYEATKTAAEVVEPRMSVRQLEDQVLISYNALPKLASVFGKNANVDDAVMALCLAGASAQAAHDYLEQSKHARIEVRGLRDITYADSLLSSTRKLAEEQSRAVTGLRKYLVKEAAAMPTSMSVDAVLSLGLINSENIRLYVSYIPYLEKCLSEICEMVLGSRLGMVEVPEYAAARASRGIDDVIRGLKSLALRDTKE